MNHQKTWNLQGGKARLEPVVFKRWSNRKWAVLASIHKVILIGTLCFSYNLVAQVEVSGDADSSQVRILVELEEVEAREESPGTLENSSLKPLILLSARDIQSEAVTSHEEVFENLPGLDIRQRGRHGVQADVSIQGGTFDQSMVLLNGINLSDPQTGHFQMNLPLDLHSISQVEVATGSASRRYGTNAFSGIINVITRPADSTFFNAGISLGQYHFYKTNLNSNISGNHVSTLVGISTAGSEGYRENTDFKNTRAYIHASTRPGGLKADFMLGVNQKKFGANAFYSPIFPNQYEETTTGLAALKLVLSGQRSNMVINAYSRMNRDHFQLVRSDPSFYTNDHQTRVLGMDMLGQVSWKAGVSHTGIHYRSEQIRSTALGEPLDPGDFVHWRDSIVFTHSQVRNQLNWNLNHTAEIGPVTLSGGGMVHMTTTPEMKPHILPGMDIRLKLPASFRLYTSLNQSMRLPTYTDLYYQGPGNVGNPQLKHETATTLELGLYRENRGIYMGLNGFYRQGKDMIDWIWMDDNRWHTMNLTRIDALGGDLIFRYDNDRSGRFMIENGEFSYTFVRLTKISEEVSSRYVLDNLKHKVYVKSVFRLFRDISLSISATYQERNGGYMSRDPDTGASYEQSYDPFLMINTKLIYSIRNFHLFLQATNLTDVQYQDIGHVIQPGRWIIGGIEIR